GGEVEDHAAVRDHGDDSFGAIRLHGGAPLAAPCLGGGHVRRTMDHDAAAPGRAVELPRHAAQPQADGLVATTARGAAERVGFLRDVEAQRSAVAVLEVAEAGGDAVCTAGGAAPVGDGEGALDQLEA